MGYLSSDADVRKYINKVPYVYAVLVLIVTFVFFFFFLGDKDLVYVHHCSFSYWAYDFQHTMLRFVARCVYIPLAILLGAIVMRLIPTNESLAKWGSVTLFIFIYHTFAITALSELTKRGYLLQNEMMLFVYAIIITFGLLYLSRFRILTFLLNPISSIRKRVKVG